MQSYNPAIPGALFQDYWMVAKHVNIKNVGKPRVLLLLLQPSVRWISIVTFNNDAKPPPRWILREFDVSRIRSRLGGLPHLETLTLQNLTPAGRVTRLADRATRLGGSPHLSCKRDQVIWTGGLPYLSELPHLPGVPHLHVNRPLNWLFTVIWLIVLALITNVVYVSCPFNLEETTTKP